MTDPSEIFSNALVKSLSSTSQTVDLNAEETLSDRKRKKYKEDSCGLNDIGHVAEMLINLSRARVDQETVADSVCNNGMENPNLNGITFDEKSIIDDHDGSCTRVRKTDRFIGVTDDRGRWQANIWLKNHRRQVNLGRYFIAEAAARSSDKAMLVTRDRAQRRLNYPETDYDTRIVEEWRKVYNVDAKKFIEKLLEQSSSYSEGCIEGLNAEAGNELLELIKEKKLWETGH